MPPAALGQEAVLAAGDESGAVAQGDPVGVFDRRPVIEHERGLITAAGAAHDRAVDVITGPDVGQGLGAAVGHQDAGVAGKAVNAGVGAPAIGVDRELEGHL